MDISFVLIILLFGSIATYFVGNKWASKAALIFSTAAFVATIYITYVYNQGEPVSFVKVWMQEPNILLAFEADGLSLTMLLLTTALTPIVILSTFKNTISGSRSFYALIMFMAFAMAGTFISVDGFIYYIFWELSLLPIYFIALVWGKGDLESRKKAVIKFFIYTFAGSLFMLAAFIFLYQRTGSFLTINLYRAFLTSNEQFFIFLAFFLAYAIKIPIIPFHTWQANVYQSRQQPGLCFYQV